MHGGISPTLVKETACTVQVVEVVLIFATPPEAHVTNFKVAPEMTRRIAISLVVVIGPPGLVHQPVHGIVFMHVGRVRGKELGGLGPQGGDRVGGIVEIDRETVRLVVVLHEAEDVVINVAKEVHLGLNPPVVLRVGQRRVLVEETAVPAAHLVVRHHAGVLNLVFF